MSAIGLRVLVVPPSYFARNRTTGGGERYAFEYARALAALTPTTLALFDVEPQRRALEKLEIRHFTVRHFNQRFGFPLTWASWRALRAYDVLHVHVMPTPLTDLLILLGRLARQLVVLTDHGGGGPCWSTYLGKIHPRLNLNRRAHGVAVVSNYAGRLFAGWPKPVTVLQGGVNLTEFAPRDTAPEGYALFVGRLLPHKGVLELIRALGPETPLRVVGRPYAADYVAQLQHAATGKRVQFLFDADDAELKRQYAGANVVLQPTLPSTRPGIDTAELLGLVTLEAMACGKPVIVTRTASLPELVREGETGFIVAPHDRAALQERVHAFLADPSLSRRMGAAARKHVENHFTWERVASRGMDFYRQLLAKTKPCPGPA